MAVKPHLALSPSLGQKSSFLWMLMALYAAALLEELESLVEQLDQQEASKKQALDRAEAAERDQITVLYLCLPTHLLFFFMLMHCQRGCPFVHSP